MNLSIVRIKIIFILAIIKQCSSCSLQVISMLSSGKSINTEFLVALFYVPHSNYTKDKYVYKCLGALVDNGVVIAPSSCAIPKLEHKIKVRYYKWVNYQNLIKGYAPFYERSVQKIISYPDVNNSINACDDFNILFLSSPLKVNGTAIMSKEFYSRDQRFYNSFYKMILPPCMLLNLEKTNNSMKLQFNHADAVFPPHCCQHFGYNITYHDDDNYVIDDRCYNEKLSEITCFRNPDFFCKESYNNSLLICSSGGNSQYLYGFVRNTNNCAVEVSNIDRCEEWISEQMLNYLAHNNLQHL